MKFLKLTIIVAVVLASFTSCTKQDLNEDEVITTYATGGGADMK